MMITLKGLTEILTLQNYSRLNRKKSDREKKLIKLNSNWMWNTVQHQILQYCHIHQRKSISEKEHSSTTWGKISNDLRILLKCSIQEVWTCRRLTMFQYFADWFWNASTPKVQYKSQIKAFQILQKEIWQDGE